MPLYVPLMLLDVPLILKQLLDNVDSIQKHAAVRGGVDVHVLLVHNVKGTILCLDDDRLLFIQTCMGPEGEKGRQQKEKREREVWHLLGLCHRGSLLVQVKPGESK